MRIVVAIMSGAAGTWRQRVVKVECGCCVRKPRGVREWWKKRYLVVAEQKLDGLPSVGDSSRESINAQDVASDQRAPRGGLQLKQ